MKPDIVINFFYKNDTLYFSRTFHESNHSVAQLCGCPSQYSEETLCKLFLFFTICMIDKNINSNMWKIMKVV